jgi:hypothetical protein
MYGSFSRSLGDLMKKLTEFFVFTVQCTLYTTVDKFWPWGKKPEFFKKFHEFSRHLTIVFLLLKEQ